MKHPSKNSTIPDTEVSISERVKGLRLRERFSQKEFAETIGISLSRYKHLEYLKTPLKMREADAICIKFNLNQRWLATGKLPMHPVLPIGCWDEIHSRLDDDFSQVYSDHLFEQAEEAIAELSKFHNTEPEFFDEWIDFPKTGKPFNYSIPYEYSERFLVDKVRYYYESIWEDQLKREYVKKVADFAEETYGDFVEDLLLEIRKEIEEKLEAESKNED